MIIDFNKLNGLVPAIIQDVNTKEVLMLGYMNKEAYEKTMSSKLVTFFSRSKNRIWTKGEDSGNYLKLVELKADCDQDTLLIQADPVGPVCHKGTTTCWGERVASGLSFLPQLEATITQRITSGDQSTSYTKELYEKGIAKIAQKVGEEAVEVVIEAMQNQPERFVNESADLLYHFLILLQAKGIKLQDVINTLEMRMK